MVDQTYEEFIYLYCKLKVLLKKFIYYNFLQINLYEGIHICLALYFK